ncbi:hypothetical protein [Tautonia sociabilis]|uniref:hypothetical protein n=1 Tax=Tautonia sociabilis TaxID=2080755 RepID=UPI000F85BD86|nr:hypothetical protein [Tautonia sociabilis]
MHGASGSTIIHDTTDLGPSTPSRLTNSRTEINGPTAPRSDAASLPRFPLRPTSVIQRPGLPSPSDAYVTTGMSGRALAIASRIDHRTGVIRKPNCLPIIASRGPQVSSGAPGYSRSDW